MDHSGGHMGHHMPGMDMPDGDMDMEMCSMNMLFTWSTKNLCIIFPAWRVSGPASLLLSLLLVVALTAGYEAVRAAARSFDRAHPPVLFGNGAGYSGGNPGTPSAVVPPSPYTDGVGGALGSSPRILEDARSRTSLGAAAGRRVTRAAFYAVQVFYSFFIMLLFMTYNGWIMLAVAAGAFAGHLMFAPADEGAAKTVACH